MLIHRRIDEQCGKRKKSWVRQLRAQAEYIVDSMPTETFSSSKEDVFNDTMKERALKEILPSLFNVAEAHEDYFTQYELFEGTNNKDPLKGKHITWKRLPRPPRGYTTRKRHRPSKPAAYTPREEPVSEDSGEETEADNMSASSSCFSSFQTKGDFCGKAVQVKQESSPSPRLSSIPTRSASPPDRTKRSSESPEPEPVAAESEPVIVQPGPVVAQPEPVVAQLEPVAAPFVAFDQSLRRLQLSDMSDMSNMDTKQGHDFQAIQFPYSFGNAGFQTFNSMVVDPTHNPTTTYPYSPGLNNNLFVPQEPNGLPSGGNMAGFQVTYMLPTTQTAYSELLHLDDLATEYSRFQAGHTMPMSDPQPDSMLDQSDFSHGFPMSTFPG